MGFMKKYLKYLLILGLCGTGKTLASNDKLPGNVSSNVGIEQSNANYETGNKNEKLAGGALVSQNVGVEQSGEGAELKGKSEKLTSNTSVAKNAGIKQTGASVNLKDKGGKLVDDAPVVHIQPVVNNTGKGESGDKNVLKEFFDKCGQYSPEEVKKIKLKIKSKSGGEDGKASYLVEVSGFDEFKKMGNGSPLAFRVDRDLKLGDCKDNKIGFDYDFNLTFDGRTKEDFKVFCKVIKSNKIFDFLFGDIVGSASGDNSLDSKLLKKFGNMLMSSGDKHLEVNFSNVNWPKIDLNINDKITIGSIDGVPSVEAQGEVKSADKHASSDLKFDKDKKEEKLISDSDKSLDNEKEDKSSVTDKKINDKDDPQNGKKEEKLISDSDKSLDDEKKDKSSAPDQKINDKDDPQNDKKEEKSIADSDKSLDNEKKDESPALDQKIGGKKVNDPQNDKKEEKSIADSDKSLDNEKKGESLSDTQKSEKIDDKRVDDVQKAKNEKSDESSAKNQGDKKVDEKKESAIEIENKDKKGENAEKKDEASTKSQGNKKVDEKKESAIEIENKDKKGENAEKKDKASTKSQGDEKADKKREDIVEVEGEDKKEQKTEKEDSESTAASTEKSKVLKLSEEGWVKSLSARQLHNPEVMRRVLKVREILDEKYPFGEKRSKYRDFAGALLMSIVWGSPEGDDDDFVKSISPDQFVDNGPTSPDRSLR